jgi:DUF1680 family protein
MYLVYFDRLLAAVGLPEYIASYDVPEKALYLDLFADATVSLAPLGAALTAAALRMETAWPYSPNVSLTLALPATDPTSLTLMLRIPGWVAEPSVGVFLLRGNQHVISSISGPLCLSVKFNNVYVPRSRYLTPHAGGARTLVGTGVPGSYLKVKRSDWVDGDTLSFSLPMRLKVTKYTGLTKIPNHERYAVEFGPILLCAVGGSWDRTIDSMLIRGVKKPDDPE